MHNNVVATKGMKNIASLLHPSGSAFSKKERLGGSNEDERDDDDDVREGDTFAVVENPLYGENEGDIDAYLKEELEETEKEVI